MDLGLTGKVAMVSGASRGLGRAMAHALADEGMHLSICARTRDALNEAVVELSRTGSAVGFVGDLTRPEDAQKWVDETVARFGGVDVLVNNAGAARPGALAELPESAWQGEFDLQPVRAGAARAAVRPAHGTARRRLDHQHRIHLWARVGRAANLQCVEGGAAFVHQDARARVRAEEYPRQHDRARIDSRGGRNLGAELSRESRLRERFHQPRNAGRAPAAVPTKSRTRS